MSIKKKAVKEVCFNLSFPVGCGMDKRNTQLSLRYSFISPNLTVNLNRMFVCFLDKIFEVFQFVKHRLNMSKDNSINNDIMTCLVLRKTS